TAGARYVVACIGLASMFLVPFATYFFIPKASGPEIVLSRTANNNTAEFPATMRLPVFDPGIQVAQQVQDAVPPIPPPINSGTTRLLDRATRLVASCVPWTVLLWAIG